MQEKYRFDTAYRCVYEYDDEKKCYIFIGKTKGKMTDFKKRKFIEEYEEQELNNDEGN